MAYIDQERKAEMAPAIKAVLKKYKMKGSIAIRHYSTLVVNLKSGPLDITNNEPYVQINQYWLTDHYAGKELAFLQELVDAMMNGNHDRSDIQSDYFDVGWYININAGKWDKPYILTA